MAKTTVVVTHDWATPKNTTGHVLELRVSQSGFGLRDCANHHLEWQFIRRGKLAVLAPTPKIVIPSIQVSAFNRREGAAEQGKLSS